MNYKDERMTSSPFFSNNAQTVRKPFSNIMGSLLAILISPSAASESLKDPNKPLTLSHTSSTPANPSDGNYAYVIAAFSIGIGLTLVCALISWCIKSNASERNSIEDKISESRGFAAMEP